MSIAASDLKLYGAASRPEDDTSTSGGDEDLLARPLDSQLTANAAIQLVSDNAGDVQNVTVYGRDAAGTPVSETKTLTGTTPVITTQVFERVTKISLASVAIGTILAKQGASGTTRHTFAAGERYAFINFIGSSSDPSTQKVRYEKLHWTNAHATLDLQASVIKLTADPDSKFKIGVAATLDDTATVANRLAAPGGISFVDDNVAANVPNSQVLTHGSEIGVWIEQTLAAGAVAAKSTFTLQLSGSSI